MKYKINHKTMLYRWYCLCFKKPIMCVVSDVGTLFKELLLIILIIAKISICLILFPLLIIVRPINEYITLLRLKNKSEKIPRLLELKIIKRSDDNEKRILL